MQDIMETQLSIALFITILCATAKAADGDSTAGNVLALDRKAGLLFLTDRSVWSLDMLRTPLPDNLNAGERVDISYKSDEDGISEIRHIRIPGPEKITTGVADIIEGTVLAFDRRENVVVLTDRTVWRLELSKSPVPSALTFGDRIRIEYDSDEEGVSLIYGIEILTN
jgi:hypothetical protein